ncbi:PIG-L deacetylase family protein [bacterium]
MKGNTITDNLLIKQDTLNVCIIVAHPDDETLWAGGLILMHPRWRCFIFSLCRAFDPDRAPKFKTALACLGASGSMADMDDGSEQHPLSRHEVLQAILKGIDPPLYDLIITHGPKGEYTQHRRHEEVSLAVLKLVQNRQIVCRELWQFAYDDGGGQFLPRADAKASFSVVLHENIWKRKYKILTEIYGFASDSWESRTTPHTEAFNKIDIFQPDSSTFCKGDGK